MNHEHRIELDHLRRRLTALEAKLSTVQGLKSEVAAFATDLERLAARLNAEAVSPGPAKEMAPSLPELAVPPVIEHATPSQAAAGPVWREPIRPNSPPAAALSFPQPSERTDENSDVILSVEPVALTASSTDPAPEGFTPATPPPDSERPGDGSFEMRLGTYWLVRVGIVMVLTAMVFFGRYAYQNYIGQLGPAGKISILYLVSGVLVGFGVALQRKDEAVRRYGEVLFAGGLAGVYFTTFAAHYIPNLRIIDSALLAGALLLAWAGVMVWIADRRQSEVLALFAIGLAYYSSAITKIDWFTLFSNLVLTLAVVFFLVRNRWATLSVISLGATYASYGYWRFYSNEGWGVQTELPLQTVQKGVAFLAAYWIAFTAAAFLSRTPKLTGPARVMFGTLNNGALFGLTLLTMAHLQQTGFWKLSLGFGLVLVGLAWVAKRTLESEPAMESAYLTQGLLLLTVGFIAKFSGMNLALILAAQSVLLLFLGYRLDRPLLRGGAWVVAGLGAVYGLASYVDRERPHLLLGIVLGAFMVINAWQTAQREAPQPREVRLGTFYFSCLALIWGLVVTWSHTPAEYLPIALAALAVVFTASIYVLGIPEIVWLGQLYLLVGQVVWMNQPGWGKPAYPAWSTALLVIITLGLSHWWQRPHSTAAGDSRLPKLCQSLYALALVGILMMWIRPLISASAWIALSSGLALSLTFYGLLTRLWTVAAAGQLFLFASVFAYLSELSTGQPSWSWPLVPIFALAFLSWLAAYLRQFCDSENANVTGSLDGISVFYRWSGLALTLIWTYEHIPIRERCWFLILLSTGVFVFTLWKQSRDRMLFSAVLSAAGLWWLWVSDVASAGFYWPTALAVVIFLSQQQLARRYPDTFDLPGATQNAIIVVGGLSFWWFLSRWITVQAGGFYLTVSWTLVAMLMFGAGLLLHERMYRWLGLGVLALAAGRVVLIDVWKLDQVYRIVSFMALGVALLVVGFVYNRFQSKIREWL